MEIPFVERPDIIFSDQMYRIYYSENKAGFDYFEKTPYLEIDFDSKNAFHMNWYFFTQEAIAYFLGILINKGMVENVADDLSSLHSGFISEFSRNTDINGVLELISEKDALYLLNWFIYLLDKSMDVDIAEMLDENFQQNLIDNMNYLTNYLIGNK